MTRFLLLLLPLVLLSACGREPAGTDPVTLDELTIEVYDSSREIGYTNKEAGFYYTESSNEQSSGWQGWHVMSKKVLDDYAILVDGKDLLRTDVHLARVSPHQFTRSYKVGVQETVTFLDSVNALVVELANVKGTELAIQPVFGISQDRNDYIVNIAGSSAYVAAKSHPRRAPRDNEPAWIGISILGNSNAAPGSFPRGHRFAPASVRATVTDGRAVAVLVAGDTMDETVLLLDRVERNYESMIQSRRTRMERILQRAFVRTDNERFDKALHWAILSADALVMNQGKKGIFAGLPWFSNYWGRDSFISLPGIALATGNFRDAKAILRSFAEWQEKDYSSMMEGRIPNLVTTTSMSYNTTDGTPWFVLALGDYATSSGDTAFVREMYPVVKRTVEGSLRHRVDKDLLLVHEDAETWMDAVGPGGPWSPRGNRANDIQALWYKQLLVAAWMAQTVGDPRSFQNWFSAAENVRSSFNRLFIDPSTREIYDHLRKDGTGDRSLRPNQLFTLDLIGDAEIQFNAFKRVTEGLVYQHGVASLSQDDPRFHPYHHYEPYYVQDAAYHNGIVWTWLAGPWISAATRFGYSDLAYQVTDNMVRQILDRGAVGTMSELLDAAPRAREGEPRLSGTFSQAWSLAEFIRVAYQDYLGISADAVENRIELHPRFPSSIRSAAVNIPFGSTAISAHFQSAPSEGVITLASPAGAPTVDVVVTWQLENVEQNFAYMLAPGSTATLTVSGGDVSIEDAGGERISQMNVQRLVEDEAQKRPLTLASPVIRPGLASMKGPSHRLLTLSEIKGSTTNARRNYDVSDPENDDVGTGSYRYASTPNLQDGSLDVKRFSVSESEGNVHFLLEFRNLSNPGWHPEYGFQLTFSAIAIDKDGVTGSGQTAIGRNSGFTLPKNSAFESIIFVGGGILVQDAQGTTLAEYRPVEGDEKNPLGNAASRSISFSLPTELIGRPQSSWRYTVLVGAQDDHGGAGIGDFRSVQREAGEWTGGGKTRSSDPNVYDVIQPQQ